MKKTHTYTQTILRNTFQIIFPFSKIIILFRFEEILTKKKNQVKEQKKN